MIEGCNNAAAGSGERRARGEYPLFLFMGFSWVIWLRFIPELRRSDAPLSGLVRINSISPITPAVQKIPYKEGRTLSPPPPRNEKSHVGHRDLFREHPTEKVPRLEVNNFIRVQ